MRMTGIEPALSAWEAERSGLLCSLTCRARCPEVTVTNRWTPRLMARQPWGAGFPRAGAGKILPRPRRTVGGEKAGRPEPYTGGTGARAPASITIQVLIALVLDVSLVDANAPPSLGFILSPDEQP